ncbi:unnamed protein product [Peronospora farinosa]|uniref:CCHC-type domain-containing protein n=1 Tax=Peronospora farinosa TaxID=134698 RepID=A0AAV0SZK5_9STRA|nr:unnamed protein product [Peronospora farinosa]CAI5711634.1 unnamed protein product [Peronospora farinosa]
MTVNFTSLNGLQVSKSYKFATFTSPKDEIHEDKHGNVLKKEKNENQRMSEDLSPLERLMQHSQEFRLNGDNDTKGDEEDNKDKDKSEKLANSWQMESNSMSSRFSTGDSKHNTFRRRGNFVRHWELGRLAVDHLVEKDMDEINYDAELETVWDEEQVKQRKFDRALRREHDKDHVCTNCGERGHCARNCLVPRICSNCGNLGHAARQCRFKRNPDTIDEFLMQEEDFQEKKKQKRKLREKAAKAVKNPGMPRPKEVPTSDFNKRNESLRKELDVELDAYADKLEEQARKRREVKAKKEAQRENAKLSEK